MSDKTFEDFKKEYKGDAAMAATRALRNKDISKDEFIKYLHQGIGSVAWVSLWAFVDKYISKEEFLRCVSKGTVSVFFEPPISKEMFIIRAKEVGEVIVVVTLAVHHRYISIDEYEEILKVVTEIKEIREARNYES